MLELLRKSAWTPDGVTVPIFAELGHSSVMICRQIEESDSDNTVSQSMRAGRNGVRYETANFEV